MTTFATDLKFAARSLGRAKGLSATVILTLALGIGANAAIFTLLRGILLRPLNNRDENRLIYIRQGATGVENAAFSVPEIQDLRAGVKNISEFGDFSTIGFTMVGLGEPREVRSGVVGGSYFEVMGLHPYRGRLLGPKDDGPSAAGAAVLTYRFWSTALKSDPNVLGKAIRLGDRNATVVGILEPTVPYPADTEIIANVVTSPHHLSATMVTGRIHRMTELFGRLAPGATLESARTELTSVYRRMVKDHPEAYSKDGGSRISATLLRDQITAKARTVLWVLMAASILIFLIACSNVANLILARTVRREGELAVRAALGASARDLRRTLFAESLLLCGTGALIGVLITRPMVAILARYAVRFSVRALDLSVDTGMIYIGIGLALASAVLLAYVPRLPGIDGSSVAGLANSSVRTTGGASRRLRIFAVMQVAGCFVLLAGASVLVKALMDIETVKTGFDMRRVLVVNVPPMSYGKTPEQVVNFYKETIRRVKAMPGVDAAAVSANAPWRDAGAFGPGFEFSGEGHVKAPGEEDPRGLMRTISGGYFAALGVPILAGRDFDERDKNGGEPVVIVSKTVADRLFPHQDAVNRHVMWTDPIMKFVGVSLAPRRIVGVAADIDDENVVARPAMNIYSPFSQQELWGGRLLVHTSGNPYALAQPVTRTIRGLSADQPVEHAATLEDIRAEVLTPNRLNAIVFGGIAFVALAIAIVGVGGVLAFSVSGRTREFGVRLAIGAHRRNLLTDVVTQGVVMTGVGIMAGAVVGYALTRVAGSYLEAVRVPGVWPILSAAVILLMAAVGASVWPAARAARVDVMSALRSE